MLYKYLKQNIKMISLYITIMILNAVILYFENVDKTAIMYSTSVILYIGIVAVLFGMFRFYKKSKVLERKSIPKKLTPIEEAYVDIINEKAEEIEALKSENGIKRKEMMEFYTMWLHQVKTPIAALNFLLQEDEVKESANHKELENELFKIEQYVEMVLSYLRMESDSTDYDFEKYCLEDIVKQAVRKYAAEQKSEIFVICAQIEEEISELDEDERKMFLEDLGLKESGLEKLVKASYHLLGLMSFLTSGEDETRAWTIKIGTKAPQAAGKIHSDFERGFIKAEVVNYQDLLDCGSYAGAREKGLVRMEGKEYIVQDGDVILFRFNV